jgi:hypothetical protein
MNRDSMLRLSGVVVPLGSAMIALFLVMFQVRRLHEFEEERTRTTTQMSQLEKQIREMKSQPQRAKVAVVPPVSNEQSLFLNMIRRFAISSRVQLVKYENKPAPSPLSADAKTSAKPTGLPAGVTALSSNVEVAGDYQALRQFMYKLLRAPRLYNTTDLKWMREQQRNQQEVVPPTHLTFTLTRYVYVPAIGVPPAPQRTS